MISQKKKVEYAARDALAAALIYPWIKEQAGAHVVPGREQLPEGQEIKLVNQGSRRHVATAKLCKERHVGWWQGQLLKENEYVVELTSILVPSTKLPCPTATSTVNALADLCVGDKVAWKRRQIRMMQWEPVQEWKAECMLCGAWRKTPREWGLEEEFQCNMVDEECIEDEDEDKDDEDNGTEDEAEAAVDASEQVMQGSSRSAPSSKPPRTHNQFPVGSVVQVDLLDESLTEQDEYGHLSLWAGEITEGVVVAQTDEDRRYGFVTVRMPYGVEGERLVEGHILTEGGGFCSIGVPPRIMTIIEEAPPSPPKRPMEADGAQTENGDLSSNLGQYEDCGLEDADAAVRECEELDACLNAGPANAQKWNWKKVFVKLDPLHVILRLGRTMKKKHGAYGSFMNRLRDVLFIVNKDDMDKATLVLERQIIARLKKKYGNTKTHEQVQQEAQAVVQEHKKTNWDWWVARCRRHVPAPAELEKGLRRLKTMFEDSADADKGSKLFTQQTIKVCTDVYRHAHTLTCRRICRHVYGHVYRHVHIHVCRCSTQQFGMSERDACPTFLEWSTTLQLVRLLKDCRNISAYGVLPKWRGKTGMDTCACTCVCTQTFAHEYACTQ